MFDSALDTEHVFGHGRAMRSARVRRRRLTAAAVGVLLVLALPAASRAVTDRHADPSNTYVVRPGDTLWTIAVRLSPGSDPRPVIDRIVRTNGIDAANLVPGQQLQLPE
jgi:Tfp pilus assembly protein FimV